MNKEKNILWQATGSGNYIKKFDDVFLSYNPAVRDNIFDDFLIGIGAVENKRNPEETAFRHGEIWRILKGDFREEYDKCTTAEQCLVVYKKYRKKHRSDFSTD